MPEHIHRWIVDDKPMDGYYPSVCKCGEMRAFKANVAWDFQLETFDGSYEDRHYKALIGGGRMSSNPHRLADED